MRFHIPPDRIRSAGFTLVEMIVAMTLATILIGILMSAISMTAGNKRNLIAAGQTRASATEADALLRRSLEQAGQRMWSAYNLSGVNVITAGDEEAARDTLILLSARGRAILNSTQACQILSGASCMVLGGDVTGEIETGDVLVTGSPLTGSRLLQVVEVGGPFVRPCEGDCVGNDMTVERTVVDAVLDSVVVSHSILWKDGRETIEAGGCPSLSIAPLWDRCEEHREEVVIGEEASISLSVGAGENRDYTEVVYIDRTEVPFAYPQAPTWTARSGAGGIPAVHTQRIRFTRLYVDDRNPHQPLLVQSTTLSPSGLFGPPEPVASGISFFRVRAQHSGGTALVRGVGVEAADFIMNAGNSNFLTGGSLPLETRRSYDFARSFGTLASVRIDYEVLDRRATDEPSAFRILPLAVQVATPHLLGGGVIDTRVDESSTYRGTEIADEAIVNAAPIARLQASPTVISPGGVVSFNGSLSRDPDGQIAMYRYDFGDGSGVEAGEGMTAASHAFGAPGRYFASLTVTDNEGRTGIHTVEINVLSENLPPVADFSLPVSPASNVWLSFVDSSVDPDGRIVLREWTTSDGQTASGSTASFTFATPGGYNVTLTVTDDRGATDQISKSLQITESNTPPVALMRAPDCADTFCQGGALLEFSGGDSHDPDGSITNHTWFWGDGTSPGYGETASHRFTTGGARDVVLQVTDNRGGTGRVTRTILVNAAPVARLQIPSCATTQAGCFIDAPYTFDASSSTDPDGTITSWLIDLGDGSSHPGPVVTHQYAVAGTYPVVLTVADNQGNQGQFALALRISEDRRAVLVCPATHTLAQNATGTIPCTVQNGLNETRTFVFSAQSDANGTVSVESPAPLTVGPLSTMNVDIPIRSRSASTGSAEILIQTTDPYGTASARTTVGVTSSFSVGLSLLSQSTWARNISVTSSGGNGAVNLGGGSWDVNSANGLTLLLFPKNNPETLASEVFYQTGSSTSDANALADALAGLAPNHYVVLMGAGGWDQSATENLRQALYRKGLGRIQYPAGGEWYFAILDSDNPRNSREGSGTSGFSLGGLLRDGRVNGSTLLDPGETGGRSVAVTNLSTQSGPISLSLDCGDNLGACVLLDQSGSQITRTTSLAPGQSQTVFAQYRAGMGETSSTVSLEGSFGSAVNTLSWPVVVAESTVRPPAVLSGPGDFSDGPGALGTRSVIVENTWKRERAFLLSASSDDPILTVNIGTSVLLGPGASQAIPLTYAVSPTAPAGNTAVYGIAASDGVASTATSTGLFTTATNQTPPLIITPPDFTVDPGQTGTVQFTLTSQANSSRDYSLQWGGAGIVTSANGLNLVTLGAYQSVVLDVDFVVSSSASGGSGGDIYLIAESGNSTASGSVHLSVGITALAPTVIAPPDRLVSPGDSGQSYFQVRNNISAARTYAMFANRGGIVSSVSVAPSLFLGPGLTGHPVIDYRISSGATQGATGTITVTATDQALSGSATQTLSANVSAEPPVVQTTGDMNVMQSQTGVKAFLVRNTSNQSRTFYLSAQGTGVIRSASVPSPEIFGPNQQRTIGVTFVVSDSAQSGSTGTLTLQVSDGDLNAQGSVLATVGEILGVFVSSRQDLSFVPGGTSPFQLVISNTGNTEATFDLADAGPAGWGAGPYHARISLPSSLTLGPGTSASVSMTGTITAGATIGSQVIGAVRARMQTDTTVNATGQIAGAVTTALLAPMVDAPLDFTADPAESGTAVWRLTNLSGSPATYQIAVSRSGAVGAAEAQEMSVTAAAGQSVDLPVDWMMGSLAQAGATGTIQLTASVGGMSGNASVEVTTNTVDKSPAIEWGDSIQNAAQGAAGSNAILITNLSNLTRSLCVEVATRTGSVSATEVLQSGPTGDGTCRTVEAFASEIISSSWSIRADAPGDEHVVLRARASIDGIGMSSAWTESELHVEATLVAPVVTAPADRATAPDSTVTINFSVKNLSNTARAYDFTATSGSVTVAPHPANPSSRTIAAGATESVSLSYTISPGAQPGQRTVISLLVTDSAVPGLNATDSFEVTVATILLDATPEIELQFLSISVSPGQEGSMLVGIRNKSSVERTVCLQADEDDGTASYGEVFAGAASFVPTCQTLDPEELGTSVMTYTGFAQALATDQAFIGASAYLDDVTGYASEPEWSSATVALIRTAPETWLSWEAESRKRTETVTDTVFVRNRSNQTETLCAEWGWTNVSSGSAASFFTATPVVSPSCRTVAPFAVTTFDLTYQISATAGLWRWIDHGAVSFVQEAPPVTWETATHVSDWAVGRTSIFTHGNFESYIQTEPDILVFDVLELGLAPHETIAIGLMVSNHLSGYRTYCVVPRTIPGSGEGTLWNWGGVGSCTGPGPEFLPGTLTPPIIFGGNGWVSLTLTVPPERFYEPCSPSRSDEATFTLYDTSGGFLDGPVRIEGRLGC